MNTVYEIVKLKQEIRVREDLAPLKADSVYSVAKWLQEEIGYDSQENFVVLCLDVKNNLTCFSNVFKGTVNQTVVHPRDVFQRAYLSNSAQIIISHNHPSNNPKPSGSDDKVTKIIKECGEILGVRLIDHIIVGRDTYYSYREHGLFQE